MEISAGADAPRDKGANMSLVRPSSNVHQSTLPSAHRSQDCRVIRKARCRWLVGMCMHVL